MVAPLIAAAARTADRCCGKRPGLRRPARMLWRRKARTVIVDRLSAVRSIWPPPSPWEPSRMRTSAKSGFPSRCRVIALSPACVPGRRDAAFRRGRVLRRSRRRAVCPDHGAAGGFRKDPTAHVQRVLCRWLSPGHRPQLAVLSFRQPPISGTRELASMHAPRDELSQTSAKSPLMQVKECRLDSANNTHRSQCHGRRGRMDQLLRLAGGR
jgi:hypothetical protein